VARFLIRHSTFLEFMKELRDNYLHQDWKDQVCNDILTSMLANSNMTFWNWAQHLLKLNCLLRGTSSVFDDMALCNHLEAHVNNDLKAHIKHSDPPKIKHLKHGFLLSISSMRLKPLKLNGNGN